MTGRTIAIGDIHGCLAALRSILRMIEPTADDTIVTLGDYVNRGPDSRGVLDCLIDLRKQCHLVPLLGNHDDLLLRNRTSRSLIEGLAIHDPDNGLERFDDHHFEFLAQCCLYHETETHIFVHANYDAKLPLADQDAHTLMWLALHQRMPRRHRSRKIAIMGHTSQRSGEVLERPHFKCIDTYCYGGGWLTAMDVTTNRVWRVIHATSLRAR